MVHRQEGDAKRVTLMLIYSGPSATQTLQSIYGARHFERPSILVFNC
jgi:hypothetical protein